MARDSDMFRLYWLSSKGGHIIVGPFSLKYKCININEEKIYNLWI